MLAVEKGSRRQPVHDADARTKLSLKVDRKLLITDSVT